MYYTGQFYSELFEVTWSHFFCEKIQQLDFLRVSLTNTGAKVLLYGASLIREQFLYF